MEIQVNQIPQEGLHLSYNSDLDKKTSLQLVGPVHVALDLLKLGKREIYLDGLVSAKIQSECGRCLVNFPYLIETAFHLECRPSPSSFFEGEYLLPREELDLLYYSGDQINIDDEILGQLFLSLPMNPLCHSACRGLCPECGESLNHAICRCQTETPGFCWTDLKNFVCKETHAKSKT